MSKSHNITQKNITVYTDNKQVTDYSSLPKKGLWPTNFMVEHCDVLYSIRNYTNIFKSNNNKITRQKHIYSHLYEKKNNNKRLYKNTRSKKLNLHLQNTTPRLFDKLGIF